MTYKNKTQDIPEYLYKYIEAILSIDKQDMEKLTSDWNKVNKDFWTWFERKY